MRKLLAAAALALLFPLAAAAQFSIGASLGYSFPMGDYAQDVPMDDFVAGVVPLEINARYAVVPDLDLGVYFGYGPAIKDSDLADACDASDVDCSVYTWGFGVMGEYGFGEMGGFNPFVGARFGMSWFTWKTSDGSDWFKVGARGWEAGLQAGADKKLGEKFSLGGFLGFTFGQFGTEYVADSEEITDDSTDIEDKAMHQYLTLGVRGTFDF